MNIIEAVKRVCRKRNNKQPMVDVRDLFGTWPGEEDDGFEEAIYEMRHGGTEVPKSGESDEKENR